MYFLCLKLSLRIDQIFVYLVGNWNPNEHIQIWGVVEKVDNSFKNLLKHTLNEWKTKAQSYEILNIGLECSIYSLLESEETLLNSLVIPNSSPKKEKKAL